MSEDNVGVPLYFLVADWVMTQQRWVSAKEIASQFHIEPCKAINTISYILADVGEIKCETKTIPNQLEGRGCQCQRLVRVRDIDHLLYSRFKNNVPVAASPHASEPRPPLIPPRDMDREQKWQWMLSKSQRRERV